MTRKSNPIQLAYEASAYVPVAEYQRGQRKKMYNPIRAAPSLVQAMDHLGPNALPLARARGKAKEAVQEPEAATYIDNLEWGELKQFLGTIALFLKTEADWRKEQGMNKFDNRDDRGLTSEEVSKRALELAHTIRSAKGEVNANKLKRLSAHVAAAANKWEALTSLARFFPLKGVPQQAINEMVDELGRLNLHSFKEMVAQTLIFYEAMSKGWKGGTS